MSLVGWWPLTETSGDAQDYSKNSNNGTVNGATQGASGPISYNAYSFDGVDDYIDLGGISHPEQITISSWLYFIGTNGSLANRGIIDLGGNSGATSQSAIYYNTSDSSFRIQIGDGNATLTQTVTDPPTNQWSHIALTYNSNGDWAWYIDSILQDSGNFGDGSIADDPRNWVIGTASFDTGNGNLDGKMSDVRVYDRALSPQEITYIYETSEGMNYTWKKKTL